jgi:hypothetical protein
MRRVIFSLVSFTIIGFLILQGGLLGSGGSAFQSSGPKRVVVDPGNPTARSASGHRFVSARLNTGEGRGPLPQTWSVGPSSAGSGTSGGLFGEMSGAQHMPAEVQAKLRQITQNNAPSGLRDHAMGGSLSGFMSLVNNEMNSLLGKVDPSGGGASMIACLIPGRQEFCR